MQTLTSQPWLFQRLRWLSLRNAKNSLAGAARIRIISIGLCSLLVAGTVFGGALEGFHFLWSQHIPFGGGLIGLLFDFLFLSLAVLLVFSGGIILYSSLFTAPETAFLLSTPARADQVFAYKFQSAIAFSPLRNRLASVVTCTVNLPLRLRAPMCVKPRNAKVSGFFPCLLAFPNAERPNSISRVFSG